MPEKMYKTVLRPIEVAAGDFCWEHKPPFRICGHFDNEGGHSNCSIGPDSCERLKDSPDGIRKPAACAELKERAQSAEKGSEPMNRPIKDTKRLRELLNRLQAQVPFRLPEPSVMRVFIDDRDQKYIRRLLDVTTYAKYLESKETPARQSRNRGDAMKSDNKCTRCKADLTDAEVVPNSNYSLAYCPKCGTVNERSDD